MTRDSYTIEDIEAFYDHTDEIEPLTEAEKWEMLSEADRDEIEQREAFDDRYNAWRNEY